MSRIRMIVSDLDGTLLSEHHTLTERVKTEIRRFRAAGGLFTIATGRFGPSVKHIADELELDIPFILCNGSVLADRSKVWESAALPLAELAPFILEADRERLTVMLFQDKGISVLRSTPEVQLFERKESMSCELLDPQTVDWGNFHVQKVLVIGDMQRIRGIWQRLAGTFRIDYTTVQSEDDFFEVIPPNQSKGEALKKLMRHMGVSREEVMSIGNQLNDMDMIEHAGIGVAVANSHSDLKEAAQYVCASSYGDGVVEAMERFVFSDVPIESGGDQSDY